MKRGWQITAKTNPEAPYDAGDSVTTAVAALQAGQIVGIPTDTVYGLAAAVDNIEAISALYAIKQRPRQKAIPVLLHDAAAARHVAGPLPRAAVALADAFWPGGLTMIVPARSNLPLPLTTLDAQGQRTVAIRVPDHPLARAIIAGAGGALAVTSANISGEAPALTAEAVALGAVGGSVLVVDGGVARLGVPSTIVSFDGGNVRVLRAGSIPETDILAVLAATESESP